MKKLLRNIILAGGLAGLLIGCEPNKTVLGPEKTAPGTSEYVLGSGTALAKGMAGGKKDTCTTIQDGTLKASTGETLTTGYDEWGYNYQGNLFNGMYCDSYRDAEWCQEYKDVNLSMKWNNAWLSNKDCDGDGLLDRHFGFDSYIGSGAWLTNHQSGEDNGCKWNYFTKIVAVPEDANLNEGIWYAADGEEIGPEIWGAFATIQSVYNDQCGEHGIEYLSPAAPGLGAYK